jgi:hypothetical protein
MSTAFSLIWKETILQPDQAINIKAGLANGCGAMSSAFLCTTTYSVGNDSWSSSGLVCGLTWRHALEKTYIEDEKQLGEIEGLQHRTTCQPAN